MVSGGQIFGFENNGMLGEDYLPLFDFVAQMLTLSNCRFQFLEDPRPWQPVKDPTNSSSALLTPLLVEERPGYEIANSSTR